MSIDDANETGPLRFAGEMWWDDPEDRGDLQEFTLLREGLRFAVRAGNGTYEGTLSREGTNTYQGDFTFQGRRAGTAWGMLSGQQGKYRLKGWWRESRRKFDWNADVERE